MLKVSICSCFSFICGCGADIAVCLDGALGFWKSGANKGLGAGAPVLV